MTTTVDLPAAGRGARQGSTRADLARAALAHVAAHARIGLLTGLVVGVAARLLMRLAFLLRPDTAGQLTEARELIGQVSLDGSLSVVTFAGVVVGVMAAAVHLALEPWLRTLGGDRPVRRWAVLVALALAVLGPAAYADELDFVILAPPGIMVLLFGLLPVLGATVFWLLLRRHERSAPPLRVGLLRTTGRVAGTLLLLPAVLGHPMAIYLDEFARPATAALPLHVVAALAAAVWWQRRAVGAEPPRWLTRIGVGSTAAVLVIGLGQLLRVAVDQL